MFENIRKIAKEVVRGANKTGREAIQYATVDMADMNVDQMLQGIDADGTQIGEYRSISYAAMKQRMNPRPPAMWVDLHLTGDFHDGLFAKYSGNNLKFGSTDSKTNDLTRKYGENIFGLTKNNQDAIKNDVIFPIIADWLNTKLKRL